jgi:hypothetical protein
MESAHTSFRERHDPCSIDYRGRGESHHNAKTGHTVMAHLTMLKAAIDAAM